LVGKALNQFHLLLRKGGVVRDSISGNSIEFIEEVIHNIALGVERFAGER